MQILEAEPETSGPAMSGTVVAPSKRPASQMEAVIQKYRGIVNLMAGLLLRLDQEGPSDGLTDQLNAAASQSVSCPNCIHALSFHFKSCMQARLSAFSLTSRRLYLESCFSQVDVMACLRNS